MLAANSFRFGYPAVARVLPRYWPNPWAEQPLSVDLPFPASVVSDDETTVVNSLEAISASELFELPEDWPGQPFQISDASGPISVTGFPGLCLQVIVGLLVGSEQIGEGRVQALEQPHDHQPARVVLAPLNVADLPLCHVGTTRRLDLLQVAFLSKHLQGRPQAH